MPSLFNVSWSHTYKPKDRKLKLQYDLKAIIARKKQK